MRRPRSQEQAGDDSDYGEEQVLGDDDGGEHEAAGAECGANGELTTSLEGASEGEAGNIRAGDQQKHDGRTHEQTQNPANGAEEPVVERRDDYCGGGGRGAGGGGGA